MSVWRGDGSVKLRILERIKNRVSGLIGNPSKICKLVFIQSRIDFAFITFLFSYSQCSEGPLILLDLIAEVLQRNI